MSLLARSAARTVVRSASRVSYSTASSGASEYATHHAHLIAHARQTTDLWRKISYYVCFPAVAACTAWVYNLESEHAAHMEHVKHEHDGHLPEGPAYDYLNKRAKPFPWGMNSLFYNPHTNKNMEESA